jgi:hypothetical protein
MGGDGRAIRTWADGIAGARGLDAGCNACDCDAGRIARAGVSDLVSACSICGGQLVIRSRQLVGRVHNHAAHPGGAQCTNGGGWGMRRQR